MNFQYQDAAAFHEFAQKENTELQQNTQYIYEPEFFLDIRSHNEEQFQEQPCCLQKQSPLQQFLGSQNIDAQSESIQKDNQKCCQIMQINNLHGDSQQHLQIEKNISFRVIQDEINEQNDNIAYSEEQQQNSIIFQSSSQRSIYEKGLNFSETSIKKSNEKLAKHKKRLKNQNILKDIINSFHKYMKKLKSFSCKELENVQYCEIKKKFNRYMKIHSFNNSIIKYVLTHKYYKLIFAQYYQDGSLEKWVNDSKVNNKDMLKYWVNYLGQCLQNPSLLDNLAITQQELKKQNI